MPIRIRVSIFGDKRSKFLRPDIQILKQEAITYTGAIYFDPKESDKNQEIVLEAFDNAIENAKKIVEEQRKREEKVLETVRNKSLEI